MCAVETCDKKQGNTRYCYMHQKRLSKYGDLNAKFSSKDESTTYRAVHERLSKKRGKAANFLCIDCGSQASDWCYDYTDPSPLHRFGGDNYPYSLDLSKYVTRCRSCHRSYDIAKDKEVTNAV